MMAISEKYVIVNDLDSKQLISYDFVTKSTVIIYPYIALLGVHFVSDSQFLAVGEDKLIKYRIEEAMIIPDLHGSVRISTLDTASVQILMESYTL